MHTNSHNESAPTADDPCDDCTELGDLTQWTQTHKPTGESQTNHSADKSSPTESPA